MSKRRNILTLSTYPVRQPAHGGQHRLHNIIKAFVAQGHNVQAAGVLGSEAYPSEEGFLPYPGTRELSALLANPFLMEDWAMGCLFEKNDAYFSSLMKCIKCRPDVIYVEQPWLFSFAQRYAKSILKGGVRLVYGSQNVESALKYDILNAYMGPNVAAEGRQKVLATETNALRNADMVACVSRSDLEWSRQHARADCLLAPNGVADRTTTREGIVQANHFSGHRRFALFCASAHPPNMTGFFTYFEDGFGCLAPDQRLVVAGGAGPAIFADERAKRVPGLAHACLSSGVVPEDCLQGLLHTAHAIVLPLTQGGGTNLKTAEALWSGKHIIATTAAFRGFEEFMNAAGVSIADDKGRFLHALRRAMTAPPLVLDPAEKAGRKAVLWEHTLSALSARIHTL